MGRLKSMELIVVDCQTRNRGETAELLSVRIYGDSKIIIDNINDIQYNIKDKKLNIK